MLNQDEPKYFSQNGWNLKWSGGNGEYYVKHVFGPNHWTDSKFVGRFKYMNALACLKHFVKFVVNNFTPAQYFAMVEATKDDSMAREKILADRGYVHYNILQARKKGWIK